MPLPSELEHRLAQTFPGTRYVLSHQESERHAHAILQTLRTLVRLHQGQTVSSKALYHEMVEIVAMGLLAVDRMQELPHKDE